MSATPAWELSKENAAPLQRGRNVASMGLTAGLQPREDSEQKIKHYESLVKPSEATHAIEMEDDPLEQWLSYIKFYQNTFPSDTRQQFILMERCTRSLLKMKQYADDDRFIGVVAKYADKTKEPNLVFKHLHAQKVGANSALFWVAWAYVAEKDDNFPFAEQIFKKGLRKNAQPLQTLKIRHRQFQRRMSRHWLNSSQRNDQLEDEDEAPNRSRGALGGLSRDRLQRNDRARSSQQSQRPQAPNSNSNGKSNNAPPNESFSIFVENEGENAENFLDQPIVESKRVIEREVDRRKENTMDAERWNERGGLHASQQNRSQPRARSRGAPPPFAVFVDEECAAEHEREAKEQISEANRQRQVRDERTFRDRTDEGVAERLARDPLRYLRDPLKLDSDLAAQETQPETKIEREAPPIKSEKRSKTGFNKRLLKTSGGDEQSFEEARARVKFYTIVSASTNINLLHVDKIEETSQMDLDDGESLDVSTAESPQSSKCTSASNHPRKVQRRDSKTEARVLFRNDFSADVSLNQTAISTASSTVHEMDGVGLPTRREEETINTKLAMKELSMMFSSPAFGVDDMARKTERQRVNDSAEEGHYGADISYGNVGDMLGNSMLDNSIMNMEDERDENRGPRNPFARTTTTSGFEKMALCQLKEDTQAHDSSGCQAQIPQPRQQSSQENPLQGPEIDLLEDPGFRIYEEGDADQNMEAQAPAVPASLGFSIYDESDEKAGDSVVSPGLGFQIYKETGEEENVGLGFRIYNDASSQCSATGKPTEEGVSDQSSEQVFPENGDTASISLFGDAVALLDGIQQRPFRPSRSDSGRASGGGSGNGGDTATLSLFNEVFQDLSQTNDQSFDEKTPPTPSGGFSIFVDDEEDDQQPEGRLKSTGSFSTGSIRAFTVENQDRWIDYDTTHDRSTKMALRRLQNSASVASDSRAPLLSLLSNPGTTFHLPHVLLPREFRRKCVSGNTHVAIGKHAGLVHMELGRGAYGVVVLMDVDEKKASTTIAVKAQSPTDCLAWEYEVLQYVEERVASRLSGEYPFPRALSFISLADGGIFSMTAGSRSGLNLVDLSNVYRIKLGGQVPELIVLHYTSRMLRHVELLHWHGKVLHGDVKPDNFVLSTMACPENECSDIEYSDLMLVDFGRAVDLCQFSGQYDDVRKVLVRGKASGKDMRCVAMKKGKPWSFDVDTFGILCSAHILLHGSHMKIHKGRNNEWQPTSSLKRYWQKDLWNEIFTTLLNVDEDSGVAIGSRPLSLRALRKKIDMYLRNEQANLRSLLSRQVILLPSSREKLV